MGLLASSLLLCATLLAGGPPPGTQLWASRVTSNRVVGAGATMVVNRAGTILYVGGSVTAAHMTIAYRTATGKPVWEALHGGHGLYAGGVAGIALSPDESKVFVTGDQSTQTGNQYYDTLAYDARTGAQLWETIYDPSKQEDIAEALALSPDGATVYVTGLSYGQQSSSDATTIAYDATTGAQRWIARYNGPANKIDNAKAIGVSADGQRVFVVGWSDGTGSNAEDALTVAYDAATGTQLWASLFNGADNNYDIAVSLAVSADSSRLYVVGNSQATVTGQDYLTMAFDTTTGTRLWTNLLDGGGADAANAVGLSRDGTVVYVTGGTGLGEMDTLAYDSTTGVQEWQARLKIHGTSTNGVSLVVSRTGSLFIAAANAWEGYDYGVASYDAAGTLRWWSTYDGGGDSFDAPEAVAVTPGGSQVFVTGESSGVNGDFAATVAYVA